MFTLKAAIIAIVLAAIVLNVTPYVEFIKWIFQPVTNSALVDGLLSIPLLGGAIIWFAGALTVIIGFLLWSLFQILELLPSMLTKDRETIETIIDRIDAQDYLTIKDSDLPLVAELKQRYNEMPTKFLVDARKAKVVAYVLDFLLCITQYPPIQGGIDRIWVFLAAPSMADVDWLNLLFCAITLFTVEILYGLFLRVQWANRYMSKGAK